MIGILVWATAALAAPQNIDGALLDLAQGRPARAVPALERALRAASAEEQDALRCLLGRAQQQAGRLDAASRTLSAVPLDAGCGRQAAFDLADVLRAQGDPAAAAERYAALGAGAVEGGRLEVMSLLSGRVDQALGVAPPLHGQAVTLLTSGLSTALPLSDRLVLARRLGEVEEAQGERSSRAHLQTLREAIAAGITTPSDRILLAGVLPPAEAWRLLDTLPSGPAVDRARAEVSARLDVELGLQQWSALLSGGAPVTADERLSVVQSYLSVGRVGEAYPLMADLLGGAGDASSAAQWALAFARLRRGEREEAIEALRSYLERFPAGRERARVESSLLSALQQEGRALAVAGDAAGAVARFEALIAQDPRSGHSPEAAYEAALAVYAAGETEAFLTRLRELRARWPSSSAARRALSAEARYLVVDKDDLEGARTLLRDSGGQTELNRLDQVAISVETAPAARPQEASVRVLSRNLSAVEVRIHRVDTEAFLRAGGRPSSLPSLDVAVIAPDHSFSYELEGFRPGVDQESTIPLPISSPGLYAVTVAGPDREARTLLSVGTLAVLARSVGPDLAVGVLRGDRPASGARVLVATSEGVQVLSTSRRGLVESEIPQGAVVILAESSDGVALLDLPRGYGNPLVSGLSTSLDLDRAVYLPGDTVGVRLVGREAGEPVEGEWRLWVRFGQARVSEVTARADKRGAVVASLELPLLAGRTSGELMGLPPGAESPVALGTIRVVPRDGLQPRLSATVSGAQGRVRVEGPSGAPAVGVPVRWSTDVGLEGVGWTGDDGELVVDGPEGIRWQLTASLVGATDTETTQAAQQAPRATSRLLQDRLRPDERGALEVETELAGRFTVSVSREQPLPESLSAPEDPWVPSVSTALEGSAVWSGSAPDAEGYSGSEVVWQQEGEATDDAPAVVALPQLGAGAYTVRITWPDGRRSGQHPLEVSEDGLRLVGASPVAVGASLGLQVEGGASLVTVESTEILAASLLRPGQSLDAAASPQWGRSVQAIATGLDGAVHARAVPVEDRLSVDVARVVRDDGQWELQATVRDGAGRPVSAQVALSMIDASVSATHGVPRALSPSLFREEGLQVDALGGVSGPLRHGANAKKLSSALLAEAAREQAAAQASRAESGVFDNRLSAMMAEELPAIISGGVGGTGSGMGGLGTSGHGSGGAGYGQGRGRISIARPIRGERERVAWAVVETDRQGRASVIIPRPARASSWSVRASAVSTIAAGFGDVEVDDRQRVWADAPSLAAAVPGSQITPRVAITNGTADAVRCAAGPGEALTVAAGGSVWVDLPPLAAGASRPTDIRCGGESVFSDTLHLPLAEGPQTWTLASAPGGGLPLGALAMEADPLVGLDLQRTATAGRAIVAALPHVAPSERAALEERLALIDRTLQARLGTQARLDGVVEILTLYADAGERLSLPRSMQSLLFFQIPERSTLSHRLRVARLRLLLGESVDPALLDSLERAGRAEGASDDERAALARLLHAADRGADGLLGGQGALSARAQRELGQPIPAQQEALLIAGPPPFGDPLLPDWIAAVGGAAVVRAPIEVPGAGTLDPAVGGVLRWAGDAVSVPAGFAWQRRLPEADAPAPLLDRVPVGLSGVPVAIGGYASTERQRCGDPCVLAVGDALDLPKAPSGAGWLPPAGLTWVPNSTRLIAAQPGSYTLRGAPVRREDGSVGVGAPVTVEVRASAEDAVLNQAAALALAQQHATVSDWEAVEARLSPWPLPDWGHSQGKAVSRLLLQAAFAAGTAAEIVPRFEDLRGINPDAGLTLKEVAAVARAYADVGRPDRAVDIWRAGLGAAFLQEAAVARQVEQAVGLLSSLQIMKRLTARYPDVSVVQEARFLLPQRLVELAEGPLPPELTQLGLGEVDLRMTAASWDRAFLARYPDSPQHAQSGFQLIENLLRLKANRLASTWAASLSRVHETDPLLDGLMYMEGIAAAELGDDARALARFRAVALGDFYDEAGQLGPARSREVARYAAARLLEARGDLKGAKEGYESIVDSFPDAQQALWALSRELLEPEPLVRSAPGAPVALPIVAANLSEVDIRAYQLDLRTVFLRDSGLTNVQDIAVAGVSPAWSGTRSISAGAHPRALTVSLPISAPGAWLVQLSGGGQEASALVVVSDLDLRIDDVAGQRRLSVQRGGRPAANAGVRAVSGGDIVATQTDLRGVAAVPWGAKVLVVDGDHYAFTEAPPRPVASAPSAPAPARGKLLDSIQQRSRSQRSSNRQSYEQLYDFEAGEEINASRL